MTHYEEKTELYLDKEIHVGYLKQRHLRYVKKSGLTSLSQSHLLTTFRFSEKKTPVKDFGFANLPPMAEDCPFTVEDLHCPLCSAVFEVPVTLSCKHSFCKTCVQTHWKSRGTQQCPLCHHTERSSRPPINLALKIASDVFKKKPEQFMVKPVELCSIHNEELKLFCRKDAELICVVCTSSRSHRNHEYCSTAEAASQIMVRKKYVDLFEEDESYVFCS